MRAQTMDKTLNRDLFNMCMRLRAHQCQLLGEWAAKSNTDYIKQVSLDMFATAKLLPLDNIIYEIDTLLKAGISREFSIIIEDELPITQVDDNRIYYIAELLSLLREEKRNYNKRIIN